jgi:hypothetical protein
MYRRFCEEDEMVFISAGIRGLANAGKETAMIFFTTPFSSSSIPCNCS